MQSTHTPVMKKEVLSTLLEPDFRIIIDGTTGEGGHTEAFLTSTRPETKVIGLDRDAEIIRIARKRLARFIEEGRLTLLQRGYEELPSIIEEMGIERPDMIFIDTGISSFHLSTNRGFSFMHDAPLDMRFDRDSGMTASDFVNLSSESLLRDTFEKLGEERFAKDIAREIVAVRIKKRIERTSQLSEIAINVYRRKGIRKWRIHPATRIFQSIRIYINDEIGRLERFLIDFPRILNRGGKVGLLTYHSIEDRKVKLAFKRYSMMKGQNGGRIFILPFKKPLRPTAEEIASNRRSRSARFRAIQFMGEG